MKKISLALATAGLTASLGAFAALPTDAQPFQVVVPNLKSGVEITLEGLYLRPSNSDLDYANINTYVENSDETLFSTNNSVQTVSPDYNLGFRVGLGYIFPNSGNDLQASWTHFNHSTSDTTKVGGQAFVESPLENALNIDTGNSVSSGFNSTYDAAKVVSDASFKLDSVDLNVGQYVDMGTRLRTRLFGGLRGAQVTNDQTTTFTAIGAEREDDLVDLFGEKINEQFNSKFTGVGPQFGVDSSYHIGNCFGVAAHVAAALLVGNTQSNSSATGAFGDLSFSRVDGAVDDVETTGLAEKLSNNSDDSTRIVPALDAKLGLNWSYVFTNQSVLTLEGGYQWTQYINAVDKLTTDEEQEQVYRTTSSVGFDGPYLTLNWSV